MHASIISTTSLNVDCCGQFIKSFTEAAVALQLLSMPAFVIQPLDVRHSHCASCQCSCCSAGGDTARYLVIVSHGKRHGAMCNLLNQLISQVDSSQEAGCTLWHVIIDGVMQLVRKWCEPPPAAPFFLTIQVLRFYQQASRHQMHGLQAVKAISVHYQAS
jgi:hypothetical protein